MINNYFESPGVGGDQIDRRPTNFDEFMKLMDTLMLQKGKSIYLNRSSFILSRKNDISSTGLVVEITPQITLDATFQNSDQINRENFYSNPNFDFYMKALNKFGFMADIDYPGRIVANIGSPAMQAYMENYGITFDNLFELYYYKAGDYDYDLIKVYLYQFYNSYVTDYPIKTVIKDRGSVRASKYSVQSRNFRNNRDWW